MNRIKQFLLLLLLLLFAASHADATHLMGGNLAYEYLGEDPNNSGFYLYRIIFKTYTNCDPATSNFPDGPEGSVDIGIYLESNQPDSNKTKFMDLTIAIVDTTRITPDNPSGCTVGQNVCVDEGLYIDTISLPLMPGGVFSKGYHLYYDRCCRNGGITNLDNPGVQGMGFHAFIPPPLTVNNSPQFTDLPVPFICVGDTTPILNTAYDPDGDLLVYSFEDPYEGEYTGPGTPPPAITFYPDPLNWPLPIVTWATGGFDKNNPFGPSGYAFINGFTGYSEYLIPIAGFDVIAVEIKEFRNGNLIGITRRDLQLIALNCPANPAPNLASTGGSGQTSYTIDEGDTLCFPVTFTDPNGDSLEFTASGVIFDNSIINPPATINTPVLGLGTTTSQFCWNTTCGQGQALPYLFNVESKDNGCPNKTTAVVYSIQVNGFNGPTSITGPQPVCANDLGQVYSVTNTANTTYNWTVTGGAVASGQGSSSITVDWSSGGTGTINVVATSQFGCSDSVSKNITIGNIIIANAGPDTTICVGGNVTLGGSPTGPVNSTTSWSPATGLDNPASPNPNASPTTTTTYVVTVTDLAGCTATDTVTVFINSGANIDAGNDLLICVNDTVQLNATGDTANSTYSWSPTTDLSDPNIYNPLAFPLDTTTYTVTVTDTNGCVNSDSLTIFVITSTTADAGNDTVLCVGNSAVLGGNPTGISGFNIAWEPAASLNDSTFSNPTATPSSTTTYTVTVTSPGGGCVGKDSVTVTVIQSIAVDAGPDTLICNDDTIQLNATGPVGAVFSWDPITGLSNSNIPNPSAFPSSTTTYTVTINDTNSCQNTDSVTISVFSNVITISNDTAICTVDSAQLVANGPATATYSWTPINGLSNPNISNPMASPATTTTYTVVVTDTTGCVATDSITLTVNPLPNTDAGTDMTLCFLDSVIIGGFPAGPNSAIFAWSPSAGLNDDSIANPIASPTITTTYILLVTDTNGCIDSDTIIVNVNALPTITASLDTTICFGDTVQLLATGGNTYVWSPSAGLNNPNIPNPIATPTDTTDYVVTVTDSNNCSGTDTATIIVLSLPPADAGPDLWICPGDSIQLSATGGITYVWVPDSALSDDSIANPFVNPSDTITYVVTVMGANGCVNTDTIRLDVGPVVPTEAGADTDICTGDTVQIGGSPTAPSSASVAWSPNSFINDTTLFNPDVFPNTTMFYFANSTVTTSQMTCFGLDSIEVTVNTLPIVNAGNETQICIGDTTQLNATGGVVFAWAPNLFLSDDSIDNPLAFPDDTITYTVNVTDANGCSASDAVTIVVNPLPIANAGPDTSVCPGDTLQFFGTGGVSYNWDFGDGTTDNSQTPVHAYAVPGTYNVVLSISDSNSCVDTDTVVINANSDAVIDAGLDVEICTGDSIQLSVTGGISYTWQPDSTLSNGTIPNPIAFPPVTTNYVVGGSDTNGCSNFDTVMVLVNPPPSIQISPNVQICIGDSTELFAQTSSQSAIFIDDFDPDINNPLWFANTGTANIDCGSIFGNALHFNNSGTREAVTIDLDVTNADTINFWLFVSQDSVPNCEAVETGEEVVLEYSTNGGLNFTQIQMYSNTAFPAFTEVFELIPTPAQTSSTRFRWRQLNHSGIGFDNWAIDDVMIPDTTASALFSWSPSTGLSDTSIANPIATPTDTTTYVVQIIDFKGCVNTDTVTVTVNLLPVADAGTDIDTCKFFPVTIGGSPTGPAGATFSWNPSALLGNPNAANPIATNAVSDTFFVVVTDTNACLGTDTMVMNVFNVSAESAGTSVCMTDSVQLSVLLISGESPFNYNWSPSEGLSDTAAVNPMTSPTSDMIYSVIVTDNKNCSDTTSVFVTLNQNPTANFTFVLYPSCDGVLAEFENLSQNADLYLWIFSDDDTTAETNPEHIFLYEQPMAVTLVATNLNGCDDSSSISDNISSFEEYFQLNEMHNVFTPNGDGLNEWFEMDINNKLQDCTTLNIYSRWGQLMFSSQGHNHSWNGRTFDGEEATAGTYFYVLDVNDILFKGSLMLIR
ncbi:gliding motility-associated C-terminal domain-containing protein [Bacteroidales bacterium AH-315-I05]|nr:gliding motility-associated C-terminal domain-containing protein [Bacteroidales bacterium AH-315-I05]